MTIITTSRDLIAWASSALGLDVTAEQAQAGRLRCGLTYPIQFLDDDESDTVESVLAQAIWDEAMGEPWPFGQEYRPSSVAIWEMVLGSRTAAAVVDEFDLEDATRPQLNKWLEAREAEAQRMGAALDTDADWMSAWHEATLDDLVVVATSGT